MQKKNYGEHLLDVVTKTSASIKTLDEVKKAIALVETPHLVEGYLKVKDFETRVKKFTETIRKELVDNATKVGRFFDKDGVTSDEKGHLYLTGSDGGVLQAECRRKSTFLPDKAAEVLEKYGLLKSGSETILSCTDVALLQSTLVDMLEHITDEKRLNRGLLESKVKQAMNLVEETIVPDPNKIEALVALKMVPVDEIKLMYEVKVEYALKGKG